MTTTSPSAASAHDVSPKHALFGNVAHDRSFESTFGIELELVAYSGYGTSAGRRGGPSPRKEGGGGNTVPFEAAFPDAAAFWRTARLIAATCVPGGSAPLQETAGVDWPERLTREAWQEWGKCQVLFQADNLYRMLARYLELQGVAAVAECDVGYVRREPESAEGAAAATDEWGEFEDEFEHKVGDYDRWFVTHDASVGWDGDTTDIVWRDVEVVSRILLPHDPNAFQEIQKVLNVLRTGGPGWKTLVNTQCGLHCHVGSRDADTKLAKRFEFGMLRNFAQIVVTCEDIIATVVARHRIAEGDASRVGTYWCQPPSSLMTFDECPNHIARALLIGMSKNRRDLVHNMDLGERYLAYNMSNLTFDENDPISKHTIEFRQHHASLDYEEITHWVRLTTGLVEFAHNARPMTVFRLIKNTMSQDYTLLHLLRDIGKEDLIPYYRPKIRFTDTSLALKGLLEHMREREEYDDIETFQPTIPDMGAQSRNNLSWVDGHFD